MAVEPRVHEQFQHRLSQMWSEQPVEHFRRVLEFSELPASKEVDAEVKSASIRSTSNRWRKDLTVAQQAILDNLLRDDLLRYGYGDSRPQEVRQPVGR